MPSSTINILQYLHGTEMHALISIYLFLIHVVKAMSSLVILAAWTSDLESRQT